MPDVKSAYSRESLIQYSSSPNQGEKKQQYGDLLVVSWRTEEKAKNLKHQMEDLDQNGESGYKFKCKTQELEMVRI